MTDTTLPTRRQVWGRRQSRPLKEKQRKAVDSLLPQIMISLGDALISPATLFTTPKTKIWLEIGFGGGEHLAAQAEQYPDIGFIGCEPFINGVANLTSLVSEKNLENIRIVMDDARLLLARLPDQSLDRVFILFADPWPKKRHNKRRIIQAQTIEEVARLLPVNGKLHIATDDPDYLAWILEVMEQSPQFKMDLEGRADIFERPPSWPQTRYEQKALFQGRSPGYMVYCRQ